VPKIVKRIRKALGWSMARMATEIGVAVDTWRRYETGSLPFSLRSIDRFTDVTGINPYVLGFFMEWDISKLPANTHGAMHELRAEWEKHIDSLLFIQQTMRL
jgi:transcriptional regulator with XRE-family HTH domain